MSELSQVAQWSALQDDRPLAVEVRGRKLILVRDGARVNAFGASCPHAGAPLADGAVCEGRIVCPWHKGSFRVSDGALLAPPALDGLTRYPAQREGDAVWAGADPLPSPPIAPAMDTRTFAIVGAGAAGTCAAAALREAGFGGELVLIGQEAGLPYDRTALSKFVMAGEMPLAELPPLREAAFFAQHQIRLEHTIAIRLDAVNRTIELGNGRTVAYEMALIAPGGRPKNLPLAGAGLAGIHLLRTAVDAAAILDDIEAGQRAVIIGNSFIGLEVASSLRQQGLEVSVVAPAAVPFAKQFGTSLGGMFRRLHEAHQVKFLEGNAARFEGKTAVTAVVLESGERVPADLVIVGTGIQPATEFVEELALRDDGGIAVDATLRAADGLYAAGDVAAFTPAGGTEPVRIEHWRVAQQQARVAARNMLGAAEVYADLPFFWTYHYGKRFEYLGHAAQWDDIWLDGDPEQQDFIALFMLDQRVVAVLACARERATARLITPLRRGLTAAQAQQLIRLA